MEGKVGIRERRCEMRERWRWWYVRRGSGGELGKVLREVSKGLSGLRSSYRAMVTEGRERERERERDWG
jgi:hypothetical protein